MNKKHAIGIVEYIEDALRTAEIKAVESVGGEGKFPYMVGFYESTLKHVLVEIRHYSNLKKSANDKD